MNYSGSKAGICRVWQQFQGVRSIYGTFKSTLTPQQVNYGANELADLDAGLDIVQEAFTEYQQDVARGKSIPTALGDMCRVLDQSMAVWLQQLNTNSSRLRVGWVCKSGEIQSSSCRAVCPGIVT